MGQTIAGEDQDVALLKDWLGRVAALIDQVSAWARAAGWSVERETKVITERRVGTYDVPALSVRLPGGALLLTPIAARSGGAEGRVDLEAIPTLNRVKLLSSPHGWRILTDSNVPIREPWDEATFVRLSHDLLGLE